MPIADKSLERPRKKPGKRQFYFLTFLRQLYSDTLALSTYYPLGRDSQLPASRSFAATSEIQVPQLQAAILLGLSVTDLDQKTRKSKVDESSAPPRLRLVASKSRARIKEDNSAGRSHGS